MAGVRSPPPPPPPPPPLHQRPDTTPEIGLKMPPRGLDIFTFSSDREGGGCGRKLVMAEEELTEREMEVVMTVFKSYETGLREATIYPKVKCIKRVVDAA